MSAIVFGGGLAACAGALDPAPDAASPVTPRIQALVETRRDYPRWTDFQRSPTPPPEARAIAAELNTLGVSGGTLAGEVSRIEWQTTGDPVAFAAALQARIDAIPVAPVTAETLAEIEEFVRRTREQGRAPPPVDRR